MGAKKQQQPSPTSRPSRSLLRKVKTRPTPAAKLSRGPAKVRAASSKAEKNTANKKSEQKESQQQKPTQRASSVNAKLSSKRESPNNSATSSSSGSSPSTAAESSALSTPQKSVSAPSTPKKALPQQQAQQQTNQKPSEDKAKAINKMLKSLDIKISGFKNLLPDEQKSVECKASISEIVKTKSRAAASKVGSAVGGRSQKKVSPGPQEATAEKKMPGKADPLKKDEIKSQITKDVKRKDASVENKKDIKARCRDKSESSSLSLNAAQKASDVLSEGDELIKRPEEKQTKSEENKSGKVAEMNATDPKSEYAQQGGNVDNNKSEEDLKKDQNPSKDKTTSKQTKKTKKNPPDKKDKIATIPATTTAIPATAAIDRDGDTRQAEKSTKTPAKGSKSKPCTQKRNLNTQNVAERGSNFIPAKDAAPVYSTAKESTKVSLETGITEKQSSLPASQAAFKETSENVAKIKDNDKGTPKKPQPSEGSSSYKKTSRPKILKSKPNDAILTSSGSDLKKSGDILKPSAAPDPAAASSSSIVSTTTKTPDETKANLKEEDKKIQQTSQGSMSAAEQKSMSKNPVTERKSEEKKEFSDNLNKKVPSNVLPQNEDIRMKTVVNPSPQAACVIPLTSPGKLLTVRERLQQKYVNSSSSATGFKTFKLNKQTKSIKKSVKTATGSPQKVPSPPASPTATSKTTKTLLLKDNSKKPVESAPAKKEKDIYDFKTESESEDNIKMNLLSDSIVLSKIHMDKDFSDEDDRPLQLTKMQLKEEKNELKLLAEMEENKKAAASTLKSDKKPSTPIKKPVVVVEKKASSSAVKIKEEKKPAKVTKKTVTLKRKERNSTESSASDSESDTDTSESFRRRFDFGPKRHRMASLNALAKVQCLYENESRTAAELGLSKTAQIPKIRVINTSSSSDEEKDVIKKEVSLKEPKKEEPVSEVENKRELRNAPGLRGVGKHWEFNDVSSFESGHESDVTFRRGMDLKPKNKKKKIVKPKAAQNKDKDKVAEKPEPKPKKPPKPQKKKPRSPTPEDSSDSSDEDDEREKMKNTATNKRKREKSEDTGKEVKEMASKRMASLNASAIVAATYEVERHLDRNLNSDCSSFESFPEDEKPILTKKVKDIKKDKTDDGKDGKDGSRPTSSSVVIVQDTDVTITGVYVNSSTGSSQEAYCKMQYRVQSSVTEERVLRPSSIDPPKSYTPLGALSSMRPPGAAVPEGQQHPQPQSGVPPSSGNVYTSPTALPEHSPQNPHGYPPPHHHQTSPMPASHHHSAESLPLHHHHHQSQQPKYQHLQHHHHHQQPHQPTPLTQSRCESPVRYQSGPYPSVQPPVPPPNISMPGSGSSAFCAPMQQSHHEMSGKCSVVHGDRYYGYSGYYQPAGPLISPHVLPPAPPSNAGLVTTKRVPSPLDSDPDQLQQPPPSTSAAESSDSEVLITGGDLTTFRYPSQQQTQSQQLSVLSSQQQQQQQQQTSPYSRSMHQMHYPPAYPPSYYSPYPGDAMCYSPPYQPYFPAKVYQSAPAYRRYPAYYQPGHPPPSELYEAQPPSSAAPPPPTGSQLVPAGPTAPQHMEHYPGPPGFYPGYSPGGGQCYSRGIQPPYMEYPPPCPCPMQSCPKNGLTGPLIGSNNSGSNSSTNANSNSISNGIGTSSNSTSNSNNSISNNNNTTSSSLNTISQPLKASKGPVQSVQQQHTMKSHNHILGPVEPTSQMPNGPILGKTLLHHHHVHQCKMEILEPMKSDMEPEVKNQVISTDDSKSSQYEEVAVPPTPPSSYTVNDKLLEPEITLSPARGSTGLPTVPDQTDKAASTPTVAANAPQAPTAATIPRENFDAVASTNLPSVIGRKARIGKSMAREMMYGAHALHHPSHTPLSQHPQIYSSHTHSHHHLTSHKPSELTITTKPLPTEPTAPELDKIKQEPIKTEEEDVVLILDDEKKIKSEPEIVEVFDDSKTDSASKDNDPPNSSEDSEENPDIEFVDPPRQLNSKRIKILEFGKAQCKKSPPNGYKSLIKQTEPKPYLCQSRTPEKKHRYMKIMTKGGIRKRKLMLTEQQKKRLIMRKRKLLLLEKKRQASSQERSERSNKVISKGGSSTNKDTKQRGTNPQGTKQIAQMELLPATPVEHTTDCIARGYFSEPEIPISTGRKIRKSKPNEARSKSETKKSQNAAKASANASTKNNSVQQRQQPQKLSESSDNLSEEYFTTMSRYTTVRKGKQTKKGCRRKSGKAAKGGKSSTEANSEVLSETEDLNQNSAEKTTSVNINNNILETNNNKFLDKKTTSLEEETSQDEANCEEVQQHQVFSFPQPPKRARSRTKFGSRKRQKTRHSIQNEVLEPVVPRKLNVVPRWNNGWSWEGEPYQGKVFLNSDDPPVLRTCYPAMRHTEGDLIRPRDCVLLRAGTKKNELPYVAKVAHLWENPEDGEMMMSLLWYYRPEHTEQGRQRLDCSDEVFASRHRDHNSVACIEDKCYVLTFSEYCRYRRSVRAAEEGIEEQISIVPRLQNYCNPREVPANTNPELVLFCQRVYEFRLKRLMKTPNNNN